jgi:multiple sugar transport system permease protein
MLQPDTGIINKVLGYIGIQGPGWIASPTWSKPAFILMMIWTCGNAIIIYLAGLQDISVTLYESASIDGANFFQKVKSITIPLLRPVILYNVVTLIINVFQWFAEPFIITEGGPNNSTMFYSLYLYQNAFQFFKMGYASAMAWILLAIAMIFILVLFKTMKFNESDN